jgi:hypothetical protein
MPEQQKVIEVDDDGHDWYGWWGCVGRGDHDGCNIAETLGLNAVLCKSDMPRPDDCPLRAGPVLVKAKE